MVTACTCSSEMQKKNLISLSIFYYLVFSQVCVYLKVVYGKTNKPVNQGDWCPRLSDAHGKHDLL